MIYTCTLFLEKIAKLESKRAPGPRRTEAKGLQRRAAIFEVIHKCMCSHISGMQSDSHKVES